MSELSSTLDFSTSILFAQGERPNLIAVAIAVVALSFAIWQFRIQLDLFRRPDLYFANESARAKKFFKRQALRRVQLSAMVGLFGVLMLVGLYLPYQIYPRAWGIVWTAALIVLVWGGAIAAADLLAVRLFYAAELDKQNAEKLALDYKMKKFQEQSLKELEAAKASAANEDADEDTSANDGQNNDPQKSENDDEKKPNEAGPNNG